MVRISADFLHIPGFIARPFGHYVKPVFLWIYRHTFAYIPRETGNYLRALCGDVSILLILFQLLIKIRDDIEFYRINPFVNTSGLIILGDQRYYIPRKKITIYLDTVLRLPLILVYEITDPFMTWAVWDHYFRPGHDLKKIKLKKSINKRGSYVIAGGKRIRGPGFMSIQAFDPASSLRDGCLSAAITILELISRKQLCLFGWWI